MGDFTMSYEDTQRERQEQLRAERKKAAIWGRAGLVFLGMSTIFFIIAILATQQKAALLGVLFLILAALGFLGTS